MEGEKQRRKWVDLVWNLLDKLSSGGQFWFWKLANFPIAGQLFLKMLDSAMSNTMLCKTVPWLDSAVSNSPMVGLCCVQLSDGWWAECPRVQWSDCALSNCPMVWQLCVQLSKGLIMLCQTVQWLDSAVSNSSIVSQCCVKLSNGWSAEFSTGQWSNSAV